MILIHLRSCSRSDLYPLQQHCIQAAVDHEALMHACILCEYVRQHAHGREHTIGRGSAVNGTNE